MSEGLPCDAVRRIEWNEILKEWGCEPSRVGFDAQFVRAMYYDTTRAMRRGIFRPIIKVGHWDRDQRQKGHVTGLHLCRLMLPSGAMGWAIDIRYVLTQDAEIEQSLNYYPNHSIEWSEDRVDDAGNPYGILLDAIAIMGTDEQAILHLPRGYKIYKEKDGIDVTTVKGYVSTTSQDVDIAGSAQAA